MRLFYLTILSYPTIFGILVVKKFSGDFNKELVNVSIIVRNDGIHDSMLDIWWEQFVVVQNFFISSRMSVPENDNDLNYQKEIFRATFDGARLINQGYSSAIGRLMLESMFTFIDFELKLPFKKGCYRMKNVTLSSKVMPPFLPKKILMQTRFDVKIEGKKRKTFFDQFLIYSEIENQRKL